MFAAAFVGSICCPSSDSAVMSVAAAMSALFGRTARLGLIALLGRNLVLAVLGRGSMLESRSNLDIVLITSIRRTALAGRPQRCFSDSFVIDGVSLSPVAVSNLSVLNSLHFKARVGAMRSFKRSCFILASSSSTFDFSSMIPRSLNLLAGCGLEADKLWSAISGPSPIFFGTMQPALTSIFAAPLLLRKLSEVDALSLPAWFQAAPSRAAHCPGLSAVSWLQPEIGTS